MRVQRSYSRDYTFLRSQNKIDASHVNKRTRLATMDWTEEGVEATFEPALRMLSACYTNQFEGLIEFPSCRMTALATCIAMRN